MQPNILKLHYGSLDRFRDDYEQFRSGRVALPSRKQLPAGTRLQVVLDIAGCRAAATLEAEVIQAAGEQQSAGPGSAAGMLIGLIGDYHTALQALDHELHRAPRSPGPRLPDPPENGGPHASLKTKRRRITSLREGTTPRYR